MEEYDKLLFQINRDFKAYLAVRGKYVTFGKWSRVELGDIYMSFKKERRYVQIAYSTFLKESSQSYPPLLRYDKSVVQFLPETPTDTLASNAVAKEQPSCVGERRMSQTRVESRVGAATKTYSTKNENVTHHQSASTSKSRYPQIPENPVKYSSSPPWRQSHNVIQTSVKRQENWRRILDDAPTRSMRQVKSNNSDMVHRSKPNMQQRYSAANHVFAGANIVPGRKPESMAGRPNENPLPHYNVPLKIEEQYLNSSLELNPQLSTELTAINYVEKFHLLLHVEELHYKKEIESFNMNPAIMQKKCDDKGALLHLNVPGLAAGRPSLLVGDSVYVMLLDSDGLEREPTYEGFVHCIEQNSVGLGFHKRLIQSFDDDMTFSVRFTFNRRSLRLMHAALDNLEPHRLDVMLFPKTYPETHTPMDGLRMKSPHIESNKEQRTAVENIVLGKTPPIYIIFGPPGTGKTVTMVESIYQTYRLFDYNILVCALCNDACDMLACKLSQCISDEDRMIRIYAASRSWKKVPDDLKDCKTITINFRNGDLYMPEDYELETYRVIICTFVTAGRIGSMNMPKNHFKRIFIDESGQALEPECLIAVSKILAENGKLIMAGDPKQLGPIVKSPLAATHGLQMSLLQRLMDTCHIYRKDKATGRYNPQCVTKLVNNYRSHEAILKISNQHFYDGDLRVCADARTRGKMCGWDRLPNPEFPIIFHGIEGKQTRDKSSPSYYNLDEAEVVKNYVDKLMKLTKGNRKLESAADIGIVTPYRKQCEKIKNDLKKYIGIDVDSVDAFQGQERPVIIISTVRSSRARLSDDARFHLGFLCDFRRFNVALTRAKSLLIVVGNPRLLSLDMHWKSLLIYCIKNNAYRGASFTAADFKGASDMEDIERLFSKMNLISDRKCTVVGDLQTPLTSWRTKQKKHSHKTQPYSTKN